MKYAILIYGDTRKSYKKKRLPEKSGGRFFFL